jgi:lipopolysaccharide transport system ATP-binding protein
MYVRLAFAVAAHLNPEILLVDEVLAVGDTEFQNKCLGKMKAISEGGRTVLFISHSMPSIEKLCDRVIWIDGGRIKKDGAAKDTILDYINSTKSIVINRQVGEYQSSFNRRGTGEIQFECVRFFNSYGVETNRFNLKEPFRIEADFQAYKDVSEAIFHFAIKDYMTQCFITTWHGLDRLISTKMGVKGKIIVEIPSNILTARKYFLYLSFSRGTDMPYDVWDGQGTEFDIDYPKNFDYKNYRVSGENGLVVMPISVDIDI